MGCYRGSALVLRPVPASPEPGSCNCPSGLHRSGLASWRGIGHVCQHSTQLWRHTKCSRWVSVFVCCCVCVCTCLASVLACASAVCLCACLCLYVRLCLCVSVPALCLHLYVSVLCDLSTEESMACSTLEPVLKTCSPWPISCGHS